MDLILTMAGKYTRFKNEGYKFPKYLLPWGNRSILSEIIYQLTKTHQFDNIFLIANKDEIDFINHIKKIMEFYYIPFQNLITISDTAGQAETAYLGLCEIQMFHKLNDSICIHNIDTILLDRDISNIRKQLKSNSGYIDLFKSNNHGYSYVLMSGNLITTISEKILISDLATSGLYGFSSADMFYKNYNGELYISELYKNLISNNHQIVSGNIHSEKNTIVLGTPTDYLTQSSLL